MIIASGIKKSYGDLQVLKGIDLIIDAGEIVSIVGKSGAGKSTLLHILGTLDRADSGRFELNNQAVEALNEKELARFRNQHIGFIFQFHHLLNEFTALENVCIPAYIQGVKPSNAEPKAKELLDYLGLGERIYHKPNQMSGGEAQRVAVARALMNGPSVVFADEPTGNLDKSSSELLHQLFLQLRKDFHYTFVIVTHNPALAGLSDRIITLEDGLIKQN